MSKTPKSKASWATVAESASSAPSSPIVSQPLVLNRGNILSRSRGKAVRELEALLAISNDEAKRKEAVTVYSTWAGSNLEDVPFIWALLRIACWHNAPWKTTPRPNKFPCLFFNYGQQSGILCTKSKEHLDKQWHYCMCCGGEHPLICYDLVQSPNGSCPVWKLIHEQYQLVVNGLSPDQASDVYHKIFRLDPQDVAGDVLVKRVASPEKAPKLNGEPRRPQEPLGQDWPSPLPSTSPIKRAVAAVPVAPSLHETATPASGALSRASSEVSDGHAVAEARLLSEEVESLRQQLKEFASKELRYQEVIDTLHNQRDALNRRVSELEDTVMSLQKQIVTHHTFGAPDAAQHRSQLLSALTRDLVVPHDTVSPVDRHSEAAAAPVPPAFSGWSSGNAHTPLDFMQFGHPFGGASRPGFQ